MGKQRLFERVVETVLAVEGFSEEIRFWDVSLLAENHVNGPSCVQDEDLGLVGRLRQVHDGRGNAAGGGEVGEWSRRTNNSACLLDWI